MYLDDMLGCEIRNGLCFDYDTMSVGNPLESQKFTGVSEGARPDEERRISVG